MDLVTQLCGFSLIPCDAAQAAGILVYHGYYLPLFRGFLYLPVPIEEDGKSKRELVATEVSKH